MDLARRGPRAELVLRIELRVHAARAFAGAARGAVGAYRGRLARVDEPELAVVLCGRAVVVDVADRGVRAVRKGDVRDAANVRVHAEAAVRAGLARRAVAWKDCSGGIGGVAQTEFHARAKRERGAAESARGLCGARGARVDAAARQPRTCVVRANVTVVLRSSAILPHTCARKARGLGREAQSGKARKRARPVHLEFARGRARAHARLRAAEHAHSHPCSLSDCAAPRSCPPTYGRRSDRCRQTTSR